MVNQTARDLTNASNEKKNEMSSSYSFCDWLAHAVHKLIQFLECIIVFYVREIDTETEQETGRALKKEHF